MHNGESIIAAAAPSMGCALCNRQTADTPLQGVANRQLVGIMTACVLGVMPQDSSINGGSSSSPDAVLPGAALAPLGQDGAFSSPDTVATDGSGSYSSKGCKAGQDSISLEPVSCAAGFSPVADGALLALAHLPRLLADATKQQVEEQAAEVRKPVGEDAFREDRVKEERACITYSLLHCAVGSSWQELCIAVQLGATN